MVAGFALLILAALLLAAGVSGRTLAEVVRGELGRGFALADIKIPSILTVQAATASPDARPASLTSGGVGGLDEVFYDPLRYYLDNGTIRDGAIGDHSDHVHVGGPTAALHRLARIAHDQFHLRIGQFGPRIGARFPESATAVDSGHVRDSQHYTGNAFDASGASADMMAFARYLIGNR